MQQPVIAFGTDQAAVGGNAARSARSAQDADKAPATAPPARWPARRHGRQLTGMRQRVFFLGKGADSRGFRHPLRNSRNHPAAALHPHPPRLRCSRALQQHCGTSSSAHATGNRLSATGSTRARQPTTAGSFQGRSTAATGGSGSGSGSRSGSGSGSGSTSRATGAGSGLEPARRRSSHRNSTATAGWCNSGAGAAGAAATTAAPATGLGGISGGRADPQGL